MQKEGIILIEIKYYFVHVMIRTTLTPEQQDISIHLHIPKSYIGKKIEVLLFAHDEPKEKQQTKKRPVTSFRGALKLTDEQYNDFQQFVKNGREE